MKIRKIGVDVDTKNKRTIQDITNRIKRYYNYNSHIKKQSKRGYHFIVQLKNPISVRASFQARYFLQDDKHRILRDMIRWDIFHDIKLIDVLFDRKTHIKESLDFFQ